MSLAVRRACRAGLAVLVTAVLATPLRAGQEPWDEIRADLFAARAMAEDGSLKLFGPKRADDAALVPIRVFLAGERVPVAKALTIVVDNNPAPVAAVFRFGELYRQGGDIGDRSIEIRVRLESMSRIRAVLETEDGNLYEASQFVTGAGGCTTTALKDMDEAMRGIGKVRLKVEADETRGDLWRELQLQIRHPNFSGMQIDTSTNTFTPAEFVEHIEVNVGTERLMSIESGIAISEDPNYRFTFAKTAPVAATILARDTEGREFRSKSQ